MATTEPFGVLALPWSMQAINLLWSFNGITVKVKNVFHNT